MREFKIGDIVRYNSPKEGYVYGRIDYIYDDNKLFVKNISKGFNSISIKPSEAECVEPEYLEPKYVEIDAARRFARYEMTFQELAGGDYIPETIRLREKYCITADDMLAVLQKASRVPYEQFQTEWLNSMIRMVDDCGFDFEDPADDGNFGYRFLPPKGEFVHDDAFYDLFSKKDWSSTITKLKFWQEQYKLPVPERQYEDHQKRYYIRAFDQYDRLSHATDDELALFIAYTNELAAKGDEFAMRIKADSCYGGNRAFSCDWKAAEELFFNLFDTECDPILANKIGNIYFWGRHSNGEPDYSQAFKYYSIGAAGGSIESKYRIADMLTNGYGIKKNGNAAAAIISDLYNESIKNIYDGQLDWEFADIALRAGDLDNAGLRCVGCSKHLRDKCTCYLQAKFAMKMRMLVKEHQGDPELFAEISRKLEDVLPKAKYKRTKRTVEYWGLEDIIWRVVKRGCRDDRLLELEINKLPKNKYSLSIRILPKPDEKYQPKLFITEPRVCFCGYMERIEIITKYSTRIDIMGNEFKGDKAVIVFDGLESSGFSLNGRYIVEVSCRCIDSYEKFLVTYPNNEKLEKFLFASVCSKHSEARDYICDVPDVKVGDEVIVDTEYGEYKKEVVRVFEKTSLETPVPISQYRHILRKA